MRTRLFSEGVGSKNEVNGGEYGVEREGMEIASQVVHPRQREEESPGCPHYLHL